jgi:branched-chain amino acid transport system permease protein
MSNAPTLAGPARRVRPGTTALVALAVMLLALPALVTVPYFLHLTILALIWMIIAQGQNLIQGYTGYVSIAAGGFMGVGAYCVALLSVKLGWSPWVCLAVAPLLTAALALVVGYPSLRVKGHYFAIVTLAYNMVIFIVLMNFTSLTGGEAGIARIPRPPALQTPWGAIDFDTRTGYYYLVLGMTALATLAAVLLVRSRVGQAMTAIRQNETLAEAVGISAWRYKLFSFVASAGFAGLGGALYASYMKFINPAPFSVESSMNAVLAVILGGSGTLAGPVIGAVAVIFLPEYLRIADTYRLIAYGLVLVLATIFMPRGVVELAQRLRRRPKQEEKLHGRHQEN